MNYNSSGSPYGGARFAGGGLVTDVEFESWVTPFTDSALTILEVRAGGGSLRIADPATGRTIEIPSSGGPGDGELLVRVFDAETASVYRLLFSSVAAFRMLDENSLLELWAATKGPEGRPGKSTFRVRGHMWSRESELAFFLGSSGGWSYLIATDWDCVEVVCPEPPVVEFERLIVATESSAGWAHPFSIAATSGAK